MTKKRVEMDAQKIKKLHEEERKDNTKILLGIIIALLVIILALLIYFFIYRYNSNMERLRDREDSYRNDFFPNVEYGKDSFTSLMYACEKKSEGESCTITRYETNSEGEIIEKTINGLCKKTGGENLVCMPNSD